MARRSLLTDAERERLFGVPTGRDELVRRYTLDLTDLALVSGHRGDANRLGFALQLALLRDPGFGLSVATGAPEALVVFLAEQLGIEPSAFAAYAARVATASEHARELERALGLRPATRMDLPLMIESAAAAAWPTDKGGPIAEGIIHALRDVRIVLPTPDTIERAGLAGRARARKRAADALLAGLSHEQITRLDAMLAVDPATGRTLLAWTRDLPVAPKPDHVRELVDRLAMVRAVGLDPTLTNRIHPDRLRALVREGQLSSAHAIERYTPHRRRAILVAALLDLERRLTDAVLGMADRLIGASFTRGKNARERTYTATSRDVGRLMRLLHGTIEAVEAAVRDGGDALSAIDGAVGLDRLIHAKPDAAAIADLAEEDPLVRAADRHGTLRKFAPLLLEAIDFRASRSTDPTIAALATLRQLNRSGKRDVPRDAPMPFKKEWRRLVAGADGKVDRRLYETAVFAHLRNKWRSGDVWVERSGEYRRFDSYLLPAAEAAPIVTDLDLPASADAWLSERGRELDWRLQRFAGRLTRGQVEGVSMKNGRLSIAPVRSVTPPDAAALAERIDALMPRVRVTDLLHEVARETGFLSAFTNLRTHRPVDNEAALLAVILADATNLGLSRMAEASQGVTRDQLLWTREAYIRDATYRAALARIIDAHHALPIACVWGDGTTSASDGQFFRSGKRGDAAGEVNARYGVDPGFAFYTHTSDQHDPFHATVISATEHEAPFVLDGLLHHGSGLSIAEHYTDTGGSTDHVHALCALLGFRFCPRLRDFPDRRLASIEPAARYPALKPIMGKRVRVELIREHWGDIVRLVASLKAGVVAPSAMLKKLAAYERQNQLDLALAEMGRICRTLFMLDWLEAPALRRRCHAGLNKSEQRHVLAGAICTYKQGRIADRSREAQEYRASGLNLVIAAIVYWNSTYMADAVAHLRTTVEPVPDDLLSHTSPVGWEHIALSGDFLWDRVAMPRGRRPLNLPRQRRVA